jgi:hypothetical protein
MNDLTSMFRAADEDGECSAEIDPGVHVDDLRIAVMTEGYIFKTDGRVFSVLKNKRQPINYAKTGTV